MRPWREIAIPHRDVLGGTFQQSEFAADITAVQTGRAPREYQDAAAFFERTFITEGMRLLLTQVAQRLSGNGGEPVIQLQTAFGGGKTHTMLAVYHLATRTVPLADLPGIPSLVDAAGLGELPHARVAILDGTAHAPGQAWKRGRHTIHTLWGELAWQLGGEEAYALIADADAGGTSPGKELLADLLGLHAPCVILIDELVAYIRQFPGDARLTGGTYDSNLSFIQALTEAVKLVPSAVVLASLPESEVEAGSSRGVAALRALEKTFGRIQALWKPVATEEAFEIVRRRLFEPVTDQRTVDQVCRAFHDAYIAAGAVLPGETQESGYYDRLRQAYPIHPEVFVRLYEDWTTIDGFQRTRGVLKLMAKVIFRLWQEGNQDHLILPGSLPLDDSHTRNELVYYLPPGWDPVIESDIDGPHAETTELEQREPRFGQINAARRVARTLFLGSAPASVVTRSGIRGLDRARVLLGCLQPGQAPTTYLDALGRLTDRLHYLNISGERAADATRYWFDTRANLRREMEDRKRRFDEKTDVRVRLQSVLKQAIGHVASVDGLHIFTPHADVPDDSALRLVVLPPDQWYSKDEARLAHEPILEMLKSNGRQPRYRANRLLFLAADHGVLTRLLDAVRVALAWESIVGDVQEGRLNIDQAQRRQAEKEAKSAADALPGVARECYRWLLVPVQETPTDPKPTIESWVVNAAGSTTAKAIERLCTENELVIQDWSPIHLVEVLRQFYWPHEGGAARAEQFWQDSLRYLYLPRLRDRAVLERAINVGARSRDFFATAQNRGSDETGLTYPGFEFGQGAVAYSDTLVLIRPDVAAAYEEMLEERRRQEEQRKSKEDGKDKSTDEKEGTGGGSGDDDGSGGTGDDKEKSGTNGGTGGGVTVTSKKVTAFHGSAEVPAASARMALIQLAEEIIEQLTADPNAEVTVTLEISARFPAGASDHTKRTITENANTLKLNLAEWE